MEKVIQAIATNWMPDGRGGLQPVPDLLTATETIRYLRLDEQKIRFPDKTLHSYRRSGKLRGVQVGKAVMYPRRELDRFIERQMDAVPR